LIKDLLVMQFVRRWYNVGNISGTIRLQSTAYSLVSSPFQQNNLTFYRTR